MKPKIPTYKELQKTLTSYFGKHSVQAGHVKMVSSLFGVDTVRSIITDVINNPVLLETIANRSYTHALGFDKIVLMDLSKDVPKVKQKTQLRLHIWNPENTNALPIVESLHEHSFDFISTVLTGHLENQQFLLSPISKRQEKLLAKIKKILFEHPDNIANFINEQMEIMEAARLVPVGSQQYNKLKMWENINYERVATITGFSREDMLELCAIEGHYVSDRVSGERQSYKHVLKDYVSLTPFCAMDLPAGSTYFHPYQLPHRLYYDNKVLNSTMLVTTPVPSNPEGGSLQRPTYVQHEEQNYNKIPLTSESLSKILKDYLNYLHNNHL